MVIPLGNQRASLARAASIGTSCLAGWHPSLRWRVWVFSSDWCGTYGLLNIRIAHAGKTEPLGVIVSASEKGQLKLPGDAGMLSRVQE